MKERIENLIKEVEDLDSLISHWEKGFIESVYQQLKKGVRALSKKQVDVIHRIEAKIKKGKEGDPEWEAEWNEDKVWCWKTAVNYYKNTPERYYSQILDWFAIHPNQIPPQNYYKKLVENKYAQKIINNLKTPPKYAAGSTVMLRANARNACSYSAWYKFKDIPLFVIEPTNRAHSAAQGCRIYSLLSSISAETLEIEERWIKKWKNFKKSKKIDTNGDINF